MQSQVHRKGKTFSVYFYEKTGKHSSDCNCVNRMMRLFTGESFRIHGSGTPGEVGQWRRCTGILWWPDLWQVGWRRESMVMHSAWG